MVPIHKLPLDRASQAGEAFARIFFEDMLFQTLLPDVKIRGKILPWYLGMAVRYCQRYGQVDATPDLEGMACWLPPGETSQSMWKYLRVWMGWGGFSLHIGAWRKVLAYDAAVGSIHHACAPMPHWYLLLLGVTPERQGQGIGTALVRARLAQLDRLRLPCYLETNNAPAQRLYQRLGFQTVQAGPIAGTDVPFWAMRREPA